jgi:hypothetical protein
MTEPPAARPGEARRGPTAK